MSFQAFMQNPLALTKELYAKKKEKNPAYSLRAFARDIGLSQSLLSMIFAGQRSLTAHQGMRLYAHYQLESGAQVDDRKNASSLRADEDFFPEISPTVEYEIILRQWYHMAILEMAPQKKYQENAKKISKALGITEVEADQALTRLFKIGLLIKTTSGIQKARKHIFFEANKPSDAIRTFHRAMLKRADSVMNLNDEISFEARDITSHILRTDWRKIEVARRRIRRFQKNLILYLTNEKEGTNAGEDVFQFGLQLFPLTKIETQTELKSKNQTEIESENRSKL
jgi:predicted transcriptional regulator